MSAEQDFGDLDTPNPAEFEFLQDQGYRYIGDGRAVVLRMMSVTKPARFLNDWEALATAEAVQHFLDKIGGRQPTYFALSGVLTDRSFASYRRPYVYKFVTEETYDRYIRNGSFLVSSLARYRQMEMDGNAAGDRFEGESFCHFRCGDRHVAVRALSGFDTMCFSTRRHRGGAAAMAERFGTVVLQIDVEPFARRLCELVGGARLEVRRVGYSDLKVVRGKLRPADIVGFPPTLTARLARKIREKARLASIFGKPRRFEDEDEIRIAIQFATDVAQSIRVVEDAQLLRHVRRLG